VFALQLCADRRCVQPVMAIIIFWGRIYFIFYIYFSSYFGFQYKQKRCGSVRSVAG